MVNLMVHQNARAIYINVARKLKRHRRNTENSRAMFGEQTIVHRKLSKRKVLHKYFTAYNVIISYCLLGRSG